MPDPPNPYASRGGLKLAAALKAFQLDISGATCADLGCNVGGFTDCLLQHGAAKVFAVDTGYGALAWKLRQDPRVVVLERTNALHLDPRDPQNPHATTKLEYFTGCDLATIDLAWTRQSRAIPAALQWLKNRNASPKIISLIKPHYEAERDMLEKGVLPPEVAQRVFNETLTQMPALGVEVVSHIESPIRGGAGKGKIGNIEYLALLTPSPSGVLAASGRGLG